MKCGISVWAFPAEWSLEKIFRSAKEAGFEGVEVALAENGEVALNASKEDLGKVKALAEQNQIQLYSVATGLYWKYSPTSNDPTIREKANQIILKQLETASVLGCDTILVVPGGVDENVSYDTAYIRACEAIDSTKKAAADLGVVIGIENVWNKFLLSPLEMRDFIDCAESPFVGGYFDVGNVLATGYPEQWIKILGSRIKKVHFKDYRCSVGTLSGFVDLLSGDVNYPAVMQAFREIGYDGWVTAETDCFKDYPDIGTRNTANSMKAILGGLNLC